jgi:transposase
LGHGCQISHPDLAQRAPITCPDWIYTNRNKVERLWARPKEWRAVATRYEKTARSFTGVLCLAAILDWLSSELRN